MLRSLSSTENNKNLLVSNCTTTHKRNEATESLSMAAPKTVIEIKLIIIGVSGKLLFVHNAFAVVFRFYISLGVGKTCLAAKFVADAFNVNTPPTIGVAYIRKQMSF